MPTIAGLFFLMNLVLSTVYSSYGEVTEAHRAEEKEQVSLRVPTLVGVSGSRGSELEPRRRELEYVPVRKKTTAGLS